MRVRARATPRRLEIKLRPPNYFVYWGLALAFLGAGAYTGVHYGRSVLVACGRDTGACVLERGNLLHTRRHRFPYQDLESARIDTTHGFLAGSTLVLHTKVGDLPLVLLEGTPEIKDSLFTVIEGFVNDPLDPGFMIGENTLNGGITLASILLGMGMLCLLAIERSKCVFDRDKGLVKVRNFRWLKLKRMAMPLDRLRDVDKEAHEFLGVRSWHLILIFSGGLQVRVTRTPMFTDQSVDETQRAMRNWMRPA